MLEWSLHNRQLVLGLFAIFVAASSLLVFVIGQDFFPYVDSGQMRLHVRCPAGTRVETTEQIFAQVDEEIRRIIPPEEVQLIIDNIGLPVSGINLAFSDTASISAADGDILISLNPEKHGPTREYMRLLREKLTEKFPQEVFFFAAANMTTQILNFGLPAPIDIQVVGRDPVTNYEVAERLLARVRKVAGVVDAHIHQEVDAPAIRRQCGSGKSTATWADAARCCAEHAGFTQRQLYGGAQSVVESSHRHQLPSYGSDSAVLDFVPGRNASNAGEWPAKHPDKR